MNNRLWIILAALVAATVGGLVWWRAVAPDNMAYVGNLNRGVLITKQDVVDARNRAANGGKLADNFKTDESTIIPDHFFGNKNSKVVVVQYEDFACSACNAFAKTAAQIQEDYKDKVLFIYRNFNLGQNTSTLSESAAEAAYLLGGEDKFWQMHDLIFSDSTCVEGSDKTACQNRLYVYANQLGLDEGKFKAALNDYQNNGINDKLKRDKALGLKAGISATPTWLINGKEIRGATDSGVRAALDEALKN